MGKGRLTVGEPSNRCVVDFDRMFPDLPAGNIYIALTGGVESTLILHLLTEFYPDRNIIPCTWRFGDRRPWEFKRARNIAGLFGLADKHIEAGYTRSSALMVQPMSDPKQYFNRENLVFLNVKKNDPQFVAGFTGKNTTTLDPECITPAEQEKYLQWFDIHRPFLTMNKVHTVGLYYELGLEYLLPYTHSCQRHGDNHCGVCHACNERVDAFDRLGKKDPAIYDRDYDTLVRDVRENFAKRWPRKDFQ